MAHVATNKATNGQTDIYIIIKHEKEKKLSRNSLLKTAVEKLPPSQRSSLEINFKKPNKAEEERNDCEHGITWRASVTLILQDNNLKVLATQTCHCYSTNTLRNTNCTKKPSYEHVPTETTHTSKYA